MTFIRKSAVSSGDSDGHASPRDRATFFFCRATMSLAALRPLVIRRSAPGACAGLPPGISVLFDEFHYWGPAGDATDKFAARKEEDFALFHAEYIAARAAAVERFFLFINAAETHAPYGTGSGSMDVDQSCADGRLAGTVPPRCHAPKSAPTT